MRKKKQKDPDPDNPILKQLLSLFQRDRPVRLPAVRARQPGHTVSPSTRAAVESPFVQDTVLPFLGNPPHRVTENNVSVTGPKGSDVLGFVNMGWTGQSRNTVNITDAGKQKPQNELEEIIAHELAHVADDHSQSFRSFLRGMSPGFWEREGAPRANPRTERPAYAFQEALSLFRSMNSKSRSEWESDLMRSEELVPGTIEMMRRMTNVGDIFAGSRGLIPSDRVVQASEGISRPEAPDFNVSQVLTPQLTDSVRQRQRSSVSPHYQRMDPEQFVGETAFQARQFLSSLARFSSELEDSAQRQKLRQQYKAWIRETEPVYPGFRQIAAAVTERPEYRDLPVMRFAREVLLGN